jgi:hypothetical protein
MAQAQTFTIDKFLGVNKKATETLLQLGEASDMSNWIITDDMKLQKMYGYARLFPSLGAHRINGMWYGALAGADHFLFACNGHVYECNLNTGANTDLGALTDAFPTSFWVTNNTVHIMDGTDLYAWSGTGSIAPVAGYTPTVFTASPPSGGGTILESLNYLSGKKTQKFSANGIATVYQLAEYSIASVDSVYVNGVLKTVTVDYTVNLANGTVIFVTAPATGTNNVIVTWLKVTAGDRELITNNRYFGGVFYSRFWLFGNADHKNTRYVSGITLAGVSDPGYWPKYADSDVGEYEISDIVIQYNKQIIFTTGNDSEASAWYSQQETYTDGSTGIVTTMFPVFPINAKIGNVAKGQTQVIYNNPFTVWKGIYEWVSTNVVDEKNAQWVSERIQNDLDGVDLTEAVTVDWSDKGQYWICVGMKAWVLNYRVKAWYILDLAHTPTCFSIVDSALYFGTADGYIMRFDETLNTYDGTNISASWEMGYFNFGADYIMKFALRMFITILPLTQTHVDVYYSTDKAASFQPIGTVTYSLSSFETWDFSDFSFETNFSPQPFKRKMRAKKIDYLKLKLVNDGTDGAVVLSITIPVRAGGEIKNRG